MFGRNSPENSQPNGNGLPGQAAGVSRADNQPHHNYSNNNGGQGMRNQMQTAPLAAVSTPGSKSSVISNDLTIIGQSITIVSQGHVQIDGAVQGNVHGKQVSIGPLGAITGTVMAENVEVRGQLQGSIRSPAVTLHPTAQVEGDIHHRSLTISEGAEFDGRARRPKDAGELQPILDPAMLAAQSGVPHPTEDSQSSSDAQAVSQARSSQQRSSPLPTPPSSSS